MFHLVSLLVGLGEPNIYQNLVCFTMCGDFIWRVVNMDFIVEELSGSYSQEIMGLVSQELGSDPFLS